jgi:Gpi18-like mannosyltransferase
MRTGHSVQTVAQQQAPRSLSWPLQLAAVLALAACAHGLYWSTRPPDMRLFLEPWFAHIVRFGPVGAFAHPFSNYEPAYLYLLAAGSLAHGLIAPMDIIKILSVAGSLFLTFAVADLLRTVGAAPRLALFMLVLPTVVINAALLGQCDAIWGGCCIFGLAAMMRGESVRSLIWCGLAFAFKAQAAFIAPVIVGALIGRRAPWWQWLVPAGVFLATLVPAWLLGWPAWKLLTVYPGQAALVEFPGKLANAWIAATIFASQSSRPFFVVGYVAAAAVAVAVAALAATSFRDRRAMLVLALLSATALPFLLPKMLERYYFLADVLALVLALSLQTRRAALIAIGVQGASLISLLTYIYWYHWPYPALAGPPLALAALVMTAILARDLGAKWPSLSGAFVRLPRPASAERTAA